MSIDHNPSGAVKPSLPDDGWPPGRRSIRVAEFARLHGMSASWAWGLIRSGQLVATRVTNQTTRLFRADVDAWEHSLKRRSAPANDHYEARHSGKAA